MSEYAFDISLKHQAMVAIYAQVPEQAFSAGLLGTKRRGHGAVIREDGLILTIGYVISEAENILITDYQQRVTTGYVVAYDYESGLGLVKSTQSLGLPHMHSGSAASLNEGEPVTLISSGGLQDVVDSSVIAVDEFAGRWEYLLDDAIFVAPPHPDWGGAILLDTRGACCAVGSLMLQQQFGTDVVAANMFVPIDVLGSILDELSQYGRRLGAPRPWLGMLTEEDGQNLVVVGVYGHCPAANAGIKPGDLIVELNELPVTGLAEFFRGVWGMGDAGVEIPLTIERAGKTKQVKVRSADRMSATVPRAVN